MKQWLIATAVVLTFIGTSPAQVVISEVHPNGSSGGAAYVADWFELTNTGAAPVSLVGWSMDDDSVTPGTAPLTGVATLLAGQSAVFLNAAATQNAIFINSWFGPTPPPGFLIGNYVTTGGGVGLSTAGDVLAIFDATNGPQASVSFGANATLTTFDNAAGINGPPPGPTISQFSAVGVNGAFSSFATPTEVGSPGVVPEPSSLALASIGALMALRNRRKLKNLISR